MSTVWQDLRHTLRVLRRSPAFTSSVVIALGLSIGANIALFTVINSLLLRPLPYDQVDSLVEISAGNVRMAAEEFAGAQSFTGAGSFTARGFDVLSREGQRFVYGNLVSANLFQVLGVRAAIGRTFSAAD